MWPAGPGTLVVAAAVVSGCGYALVGGGNALDPSIRNIGVPPFVNLTPVVDLDVKLTESVRAELGRRPRIVVLPEAQGDAILSGRVTNADQTPSAFNASGQAERFTITVTLAVDFKIVRDNTTRSETRSADEPFPATAGASPDLSAFFRQNEGALDRIARKLARSIVSALLEAF
jgi:hypothetical protein